MSPLLEDKVNQRAGHVAVSHKGRTLVWGGYMENRVETDHYWSTSDIMIHHNLTKTWVSQRTTGDVPTKCSGAAACVLDDTLYIMAGFHRVPISIKRLRKQMRREQEGIEEDEEDNEDNDLALDYVDDDEEEDDDDDESRMAMSVEISYSLWALDLLTWVWVKLEPEGEPPLRCDKTACWSYEDKVYMFGGFGPPPSIRKLETQRNLYQFVEDPSTVLAYGGYTRGWSNQLVVYNRTFNRWEWPHTTGTAPSPRAAHSATQVGSMAYVFGGRHMETRLNDLHCLDMTTLHWSLVIADTGTALVRGVPVGRSWQSMTALETGKDEGGLLLYGGFDNNLAALGDCWRMDLAIQPNTWVRCQHLEKGPRLWHAAASPDSSQVLIIGGLTNNILAPTHIEKEHAKKVLTLTVGPPSLVILALEYISLNKHLFSREEVQELPSNLARILKIRSSSGA